MPNQQAYNTAAANGVINVLDPGNYGPLVIAHGISVLGHGFAGIVQNNGTAITVSVTNSDPVTLNGLFLDGGGTGQNGILVRHFQFGIVDQTSTNGSNLLIEDTIVSDNKQYGVEVTTSASNTQETLNRVTANHNLIGVVTGQGLTTISNSVISNNSNVGLNNGLGVTWLAKTVISGSSLGVNVTNGTVKSYGDNYLNDNTTPVLGGSLTPVAMQ